MAIINASSGFQLFMSGSGDIPELQSGWSTAGQVSASDEFSARLLATGSFSTTYTISVAGAFHYNALSNGVTGTISSLTLSGSSASPYGQNGPLLTITGANAEVNNASMLPLSLFLRGDDLITGSVFNDVIQSQEGNDFLQGGSGMTPSMAGTIRTCWQAVRAAIGCQAEAIPTPSCSAMRATPKRAG